LVIYAGYAGAQTQINITNGLSGCSVNVTMYAMAPMSLGDNACDIVGNQISLVSGGATNCLHGGVTFSGSIGSCSYTVDWVNTMGNILISIH
jgi:hypothetical protein